MATKPRLIIMASSAKKSKPTHLPQWALAFYAWLVWAKACLQVVLAIVAMCHILIKLF